MKGLLMICLVLNFISCTKSYNCDCVTTDNSGTSPSSTVTSLINAKKSNDAKKQCEAKNENSSSFTTTCTLK